MLNKIFYKFIISSVVLTVCFPQTVFAYMGPGTGLSAIGASLALVAGVVIAILGFLWYPIKRPLGTKKSQEPDQVEDKEE